MGSLAAAVAQFCVVFLNWWMARESLKRGERQRIVIAGLKLDEAAVVWLADARLRGTGGDVRVLDPGARIDLSPDDPKPQRPP